jgi:hypothetical protein
MRPPSCTQHDSEERLQKTRGEVAQFFTLHIRIPLVCVRISAPPSLSPPAQAQHAHIGPPLAAPCGEALQWCYLAQVQQSSAPPTRNM